VLFTSQKPVIKLKLIYCGRPFIYLSSWLIIELVTLFGFILQYRPSSMYIIFYFSNVFICFIVVCVCLFLASIMATLPSGHPDEHNAGVI